MSNRTPSTQFAVFLKLPDCAICYQCCDVESDGDGTLSIEEAKLAKVTTDRDNEQTRLGEARLPTGEALVASGEDEKDGVPAAPLQTSDALHEIEEVYQAIEDVSHSLSEQLV